MRCPGQDRRYWTDDAASEAPCPQCGRPVEFFKDESARRCPACGHRFRNPKASFDCAQWCPYAEECVGYLPEQGGLTDPGEGAVASRLIRAIKEALAADPPRLARAMRAFQYARELLAREGGDPRVVFAGALAAPLDDRSGGASQTPQSDRIPGILEEAGLDEATAGDVVRLLEARHVGRELDTVEFRVVQDALTLTLLAAADLPTDPESIDRAITHRLKSPAGKAKARSQYGS